MFQLDPQLAQDTLPVGRFPLSLLLLSKDANYPWCILVPQRADVFEIHHLSGEDQQQLIHESSQLSETMTSLFDAYKMNIAALGNQVRQLQDRKSTRLNSSHVAISYAVSCLNKKTQAKINSHHTAR